MAKIAIKPMDAAWFHVEKRDAPAHFGPLLILSPPPGAAPSYVGDFVEQWRQNKKFAAPFNYRLRKYPVPAWNVVPDDEIDLDYHLRHLALPAPGGERELGILVSRLQSHRLDQRRPLWEVHVIEGLADGRFAIYMKFHHGQLDGVAAAQLIERVFTTDADATGLLPPWATGIRGNRPVATTPAPPNTLSRIATARQVVGSTCIATWALIKMIRAIRTGGVPGLTGPFQSPTTIFNGRIRKQRRFATQHYDLVRFKKIAKATDVTVNDVFLAITGGAMRRYLAELDALPQTSIVGQVPVSVRVNGDAGVGNALAFIYARLRTDLDNPLARLHAVRESSAAGKAVHESLPAAAVAPFTMMLVGPYITQAILGLGGRVKPAANLVISNVPGPRERLYFNGARVEQIYGPSVLFHGQALNITMSSYAGQVDIGFTGCRFSMPSMQKLAVYTGEALDELEAVLALDQVLSEV
ncbi:wax ester/triacylglycerol synthase family O-acyltransferase [Antrihabitans sp. YC2-6]|uniref:WS/DGAT/MGAT family O-acyltransferase n=1 Tax=Antrihabitans sp. YC2-6 TaxID=2799498 RepID=UPI0018F3867A|nr:wax ester/triacylglycerol synthase family O-acyltransferase [Antrihabitans sp. YC2-6]MBJ8345201.1 wax ester/triacylglycerol synthase family O-acyltransferase [Antrihabitans sp. YC2-6]